ncbi:MAG: hypothetical protein ABR518_06790 [Actinomycetota bacterium]
MPALARPSPTSPLRSPLRRAALVISAVVALSALAIPPAAAADYNVTLSPKKKTYSWNGGPGTAIVVLTGGLPIPAPVPCDTEGIHDCEDLLIKVKDASGRLQVDIEGTNPNAVDIDLYLYRSTSGGTVGAELDTSGNIGPVESVTAQVKPGYYLVRVDFAIAVEGTYSGTATFTR